MSPIQTVAILIYAVNCDSSDSRDGFNHMCYQDPRVIYGDTIKDSMYWTFIDDKSISRLPPARTEVRSSSLFALTGTSSKRLCYDGAFIRVCLAIFFGALPPRGKSYFIGGLIILTFPSGGKGQETLIDIKYF